MATPSEIDRLRTEIEDLRSRLADANDALRAIRSGEVDALVVQTHEGERVFALESAYEPYRVFVENMQEGAAALTPDGLIVYANARLADITGVAHSRLVGASIYQILGEPHRSVIQALLGDAPGRPREAEIVLTPENGRAVHAYFSVTVMPDGTRCAVVTDLTERVRLHEILASHEWLRVTLTSIGDAVLSCDLQGRITFLNPVAEALTGWSEREVLGQPIQQVFRIINEVTREPGQDLVDRVLRNGAVAPQRRADGVEGVPRRRRRGRAAGAGGPRPRRHHRAAPAVPEGRTGGTLATGQVSEAGARPGAGHVTHRQRRPAHTGAGAGLAFHHSQELRCVPTGPVAPTRPR